jgi:IclR family transcriptional regulator, blcABC operon repressor
LWKWLLFSMLNVVSVTFMDANRLRKRALPKTVSTAPNRLDSVKGTVPAVTRATRLLDALAHAREPVPLSELTRQLNLPKSTVHGLCTTLVQAGLVTRFENGTYHLGLHIMDLAHAFLSRTDLTVQFAKLWDSLALLPEETIILSVLDGADVVYIACRNGSRPLGVSFRIGMRLPANCTASGKALLSSLSPERVGELMGTAGLRPLTRKSVAALAALQRQLALARKRGYSVDDEETRDGMICFGAPVFDSSRDEAVAGVGVSLLKATVDQSQRVLAAQAVKQMAEALSKRMGAPMISQAVS